MKRRTTGTAQGRYGCRHRILLETAMTIKTLAVALLALPLLLPSPAWSRDLLSGLPDHKVNDLARSVLACYHPAGVFEYASMEGRWEEDRDYGAMDSAVIDIRYRGRFTNNPYRLRAAVLFKIRSGEPAIRTELLTDNAMLPPRGNCELQRWQ